MSRTIEIKLPFPGLYGSYLEAALDMPKYFEKFRQSRATRWLVEKARGLKHSGSALRLVEKAKALRHSRAVLAVKAGYMDIPYETRELFIVLSTFVLVIVLVLPYGETYTKVVTNAFTALGAVGAALAAHRALQWSRFQAQAPRLEKRIAELDKFLDATGRVIAEGAEQYVKLGLRIAKYDDDPQRLSVNDARTLYHEAIVTCIMQLDLEDIKQIASKIPDYVWTYTSPGPVKVTHLSFRNPGQSLDEASKDVQWALLALQKDALLELAGHRAKLDRYLHI